MAVVTHLIEGNQEVRPNPTQVEGYVQIVRDAANETLVHLSTWGSKDRQSAPKQSQVLQFNRQSARELVEFFVRAFGDEIVSGSNAPSEVRDG